MRKILLLKYTGKGLIFLLIFLLLVQSGGYYLYYQMQRYFIQCDVREAINNGLIKEEAFRFTEDLTKESSFHWEDKNSEFYYQGELYDVISQTEINGKITYLSVKDVSETRWVNSYCKSENFKKEIEKKIKPFVENQFNCSQISIQRDPISIYHLYGNYIPHIASGVNVLFTPPPQG